ncbi:MAG: DUF4102 domain-containing protein [Gammaproteobacteria bacterium]|nr:Arm DNA-binding domain-containing protein [Gammaproteobacteria bacterium]MYJ75141.1 DUF4102 domain-containing protein [Gammaproteobacteria bacterium]
MERPRRLSVVFVRSLKVPGRYGDGRGGHGLSLLVKRTRAGRISKSWSQRVRLNGKPTNIGLGTFPIVTLAEARAAALANRRALAQGIDPRTKRFPAAAPTGLTERARRLGLANGHDLLDERRRHIHMAIADRIDANPRLLGNATANLKRWQRQRGYMERGYIEWGAILERPWHEIAAVLRSKSEHAIRLRQCSPFAGVLPERERLRIYETLGT